MRGPVARRSIVFWNLQRLFGSSGSPIEHALNADDEEEGGVTAGTVEEKTAIIAAVLERIGEVAGPPLVVGFAEIETAELAREIGRRVRGASLVAVDDRAHDDTGFALDGLNISLLFDETAFGGVARLRSHVIDRSFITRDILECDLLTASGARLSVLVNHWPSRLIGEAADLRISAAHYAASLLAEKTRFGLQEMWDAEAKAIVVPPAEDLLQRANIPVVVMGDFNDEAFNASLETLGSTNDSDAVKDDLRLRVGDRKARFRSYSRSKPLLYNPFWALVGRKGSYYRSPRWRGYDQILVSRGTLTADASLRLVPASVDVFAEAEVTLADGRTIALTNRNGKPIAYDPVKQRGCSDHFPVHVSVEI